MERLDKILARELNITRSQSKQLVRSGRVSVDSVVAKLADIKCDEQSDICVDGEPISNNKYVYIMMNKPKGVVSSTKDGDTTVIDILPKDMRRRGLFPAGRLDKDTTGFMLITDDGEFAHDILSPSKHVDKEYIATLDKPFDDDLVADFRSGMSLGEEKLLSADVESMNDDRTIARVVLKQGLYHQVKRMFKKYGITVVELHRTSMGGMRLDPSLSAGECRYLTNDEINLIKN